MENTFFTWEDFAANYAEETEKSSVLFEKMTELGLRKNSLAKFDFQIESNNKENLLRLETFLKEHYQYKIDTIMLYDGGIWELQGVSGDFPVNAENLLFWSLDIYKRAYEFDAELTGYGTEINKDTPRFHNLDKNKEDFYFDKAVDSYESGDLSAAIINWSNALLINPKNQHAYYSRAIVKSELYAWQEALKDYDRAIEIDSEFADAIINRGSLKDEYGDFKGAIKDYDTVIEMENSSLKNTQQAYYNRGNSKYNLKDKKGACADWDKAHKYGAEYALERLDEFCK